MTIESSHYGLVWGEPKQNFGLLSGLCLES